MAMDTESKYLYSLVMAFSKGKIKVDPLLPHTRRHGLPHV